ncbi:scavenger receptor class b type-1 sr-b1 [Holotrichia oblita]|uniref:Scavenger receptor class b type-1 sr-b1 n=1 Tax=Holotrichia oblita TaxID=644536 RepID=A0ACB9SZA9_HOLOL|nr:scavenger receptor class b type-1 sr-b1 [Holotrichia oblita]
MVDSMTTLRPGHFIYSFWAEPPLEILVKVYIFNVTNSNEFLAGTEKLKVEEIGPYVYQEILTNTDAVFDDNNTLTFTPTRNYKFRQDLSVGTEEDNMLVPNVPLLGVGSYITTASSFIKMAFNARTMFTEQEFRSLTVHQYLWGYSDSLISLGPFLNMKLDFEKFGLLDRLTAREKNISVKVTLDKTIDQFGNTMLPYSILTYNGSPGLKMWNYTDVEGDKTPDGNTKCNTIEGTFEAGLFPKYIPVNESIRLYRRAFCRPVTFNFENKTVTKDGYDVYRFRTDKNFMASGDNYPSNKCYCTKGKCLPDGFSNLSPCYYNIPIVISQPHFYNADEEIAQQIEGMSPNMELHDSTADVNPALGIPLEAQLRIQVNLHIAENSLYKVKAFSNMMVPLIWLEMTVLPPSSHVKFLLNIVLYVMPIFQTVLMWVLGLLGISMIAAAALIIFYFPPERRLEDPYGHRIGYSPILILPLSSRLKDMRIS